jgi:conjugal transfer pilus assembly protein TraL
MEDDDVDTYIVSRLGDPWKFLFLDFDVAMLSALVMLVFFTAELHVLGGVVGGGLGYWLHRSRQNKPRGYLRHLGY